VKGRNAGIAVILVGFIGGGDLKKKSLLLPALDNRRVRVEHFKYTKI
jgi:hypothetical protein